MLLATLPGQVFALVVRSLYPQETRWIRDPQSRSADSFGGSGKHDAKAMLQCFSSLSKTLHATVRQTLELYPSNLWRYGSFHPILMLTCPPFVVDGRLASLFASSFHAIAAQLLLVDLRATAITTSSVITIFQTCPLLGKLDVGRCKAFSVTEFARRL